MWVSAGFWSKVCDYNAVQSPLQVPNPPWKPPWKIRSHLTPDFAFLNPGQFSEDRFHCFAQFHVIENCKDSPSIVLAGTGKDSYNKLIQVGCFLFKLPPLSSTVGGDAYDPASRDHFGDDVETNLSSQSKSFSRGSEYMYMYSASEKTSKSIQTVGSPGGLQYPSGGCRWF
jgi:hypothetical protein